jgi:hypothetical protein
MTTRPLLTDRTKAKLRAVVERLPQVDVELRRGSTTLAAQQFYLAPVSQASTERTTDGGRAHRADLKLYGALTTDIRVGDRATVNSTLMRVIFTDILSDVFAYAELEAVQ